jgi:hypothetical protein
MNRWIARAALGIFWASVEYLLVAIGWAALSFCVPVTVVCGGLAVALLLVGLLTAVDL